MKPVKKTQTGANSTDGSTESRPQAKRGNRVTQPRRKGIVLTKVQFNVPKSIREKLDAATQRHDCSLSTLLIGAVHRCFRDDVWSPKARNTVSRNRTIVPPAELVDMSNQLLALGLVLEQLISSCPDQDGLDLTSRIYLDARVKLREMRELYCAD